MAKLRKWLRSRRKYHVNCSDPKCLSHLSAEEWLEYDEETMGGTCCGVCGCCPCGSWRCWECRQDKWPFSWWNALTWKLWGQRKWDKYLKDLNRKREEGK